VGKKDRNNRARMLTRDNLISFRS